jgi:hypothetical protein
MPPEAFSSTAQSGGGAIYVGTSPDATGVDTSTSRTVELADRESAGPLWLTMAPAGSATLASGRFPDSGAGPAVGAPWLWTGTERLVIGESSAPAQAYVLFFAGFDPSWEEELNAWYDTEHLPRFTAVPGLHWAGRYEAVSGSPRYLAVYAVESVEVCDTPEWLQVSDTPWSNRVRSHIVEKHLRVGTVIRDDAHPGLAAS